MIKRSISVLLIEDNTEDYEAVRRELYLYPGYQYDFSLTQRTTLQEGLETLTRENPDVLLLDMHLPDAQGMDSLLKLRSRAADVPIIIFTGSDDENVALRMVEAGAQDYLIKGKFPGLLAKTITHSILRNDLLIRLEKSERATRMQSQNRAAFFDNMSHEIRTPLTAVIGYSEMLLKSELETKDKEKALQSIFSNGKHLLQVINDILDLSKIEAGEMKIDRSRDKVQPLLRDVLRTFISKAKEKNINFSMEFENKIPIELETDFFRVKQILLNLIGNAIKFTNEGFVKVTIKCDEDNDTITFEVKDSGIGIPDEAKGQLFKSFSQGQKNVAKNFGGSGLGLVICDQLAKQLGGSIDFYSRKGVGSVFSLILPLGEVGLETLSSELPNLEDTVDPNIQRESVTGLKGHALIVDDFQDNRDLLSLLLTKAGMTVATAEDGIAALAQLSVNNFDIVLLDMQMPKMDGRQVARTVRSQGKHVPIVAVTASVLEESITECLKAGCDACLRKPFQHQELLDCVAQFLSQGTKGEKKNEPSVRDDELSAVRQSFKKKLPRLLGEIEEAYISKDLEKLKSQAHRMVGAGLFGFSELSHLGGVLETIIIQEQTGGLGLIESLVKRIGNEVGKIGLQPKSQTGNIEKVEATHSNAASIIVIDDDIVNLKVVCRTLSAKGFLVAPARNEEEALNLCNDSLFALIVSSLDIDNCEGSELVERLRAKLQSQVPVIYMTSRSFAEISNSLALNNVEQVLTKPIHRDKLFEAIDSLVIASLSAG